MAVKKLISLKTLDNYRVWLHFDDDVEGVVDFASKPRTGVYAPWQDYEYFRRAHIGNCGELAWDDQLDFCPDALWRQVTGREPEPPVPTPAPSRAYA